MYRQRICKPTLLHHIADKTAPQECRHGLMTSSRKRTDFASQSILLPGTRTSLLRHDSAKKQILSNFGQRRDLNVMTGALLPIVAGFSVLSAWKAHRNVILARMSEVLKTKKYADVEFVLSDPKSEIINYIQLVKQHNTERKEQNHDEIKNLISDVPDPGNVNEVIEELTIPLKERIKGKDIILYFHPARTTASHYSSMSAITTLQLPHPVLSIGRPGYNRTTLPHRLGMTDIVQFYKDIIEDELGLVDSQMTNSTQPNRIHLLGVERGGMYALYFAHRYPNLVTSLILMSSCTRKDGFRIKFVHSDDIRYIEGESLASLLFYTLKHPSHYTSLAIEALHFKCFRMNSKRSLQKAFRLELTNESRDTLAPMLTKDYFLGLPWEGRQRSVIPGSEEYGAHIIRLLSQGDVFEKKFGFANDICNCSGVDIPIENTQPSINRTTLLHLIKLLIQKKTALFVTKTENSSAKKTLTAAELYAQTLENIEAEEEKYKQKAAIRKDLQLKNSVNEKEFVQVDNHEFLKQIKCPTLILHSTTDGVVSFKEHAEHAAKYLPNVQLEALEGFPHTLAWKSPKLIENKITRFLQNVMTTQSQLNYRKAESLKKISNLSESS